MPDITNLATNTTLNTKINEFKDEILSITNLITHSASTAVETPNVSNLVKKTEYNARVNEIEKKKIPIMIILINMSLHKNLTG